jgi:hypothetical protein
MKLITILLFARLDEIIREASSSNRRIESIVLAKNDFTGSTGGLFDHELTVLSYNA